MGLRPMVGNWYQASNGDTFEVVACDLEQDNVDIQYFDGTIEELDLESWDELVFSSASQPEDWSGSMDVEPEDYGLNLNMTGYED